MSATSSDPASIAAGSTTMIRMEGADALGLVHRISTQSLLDLAPGRVRFTLFGDFRGRVLHRAAVARTQDGAVWLLRDDAPASELLAHVEKHVFREDVRMAETALGRSVRPIEGGVGLEPGAFAESDGAPCELQLGADFGWRIELTTSIADPLDAEHRRILAARPRHGHEVRDAFDPFEIGLAHEIHLSKGCFTGQEALMRMVTYRGVRKALARVRADGPPPSVPAEIHREGKVAGALTSALAVNRGWIGLAAIDRRGSHEGALSIGGAGLEMPDFIPETRPLGLP